MKIQVKDLLPNPHRRIKEYPFDQGRIETLKNSIKETFFWDNLIARKAPGNDGHFEIAYGHHRLKALQQLKIKEIDIPVKDLDDASMLKIMADENAEEYKMAPGVLNETIQSVKIWLDEKIKSNTWESLQESLKTLFERKDGFENCKQYGAGEKIISKFLGPNWTIWKIRSALASLHAPEDKIDRKSFEKMATVEAATAFRKSAIEYNIPKEKQKEIADELSKKKASAREVVREIRRAAPKPKLPRKDPLLAKLEGDMTRIEDIANALTNKIAGFNVQAKELEATEITGLKSMFAVEIMNDLLKQIRDYLTLFGFNYKNLQIGGN